MSDVFISYSRENQEVVRRLAEAVKRLGYDVWWDDQLPPHLAYGDVIAQKVGGAKAAIVVWSANAAESEWVRAEADMARNQKKLIQTSIDGRDPPMPFNQLHYVSLADWDGGDDHPGWSKVKESLVALCGPPDAAATVRTAPAAAAIATPAPVPAPAPVTAPPPPRATPRRSNRLLFVLIGLSLLILAAVGVLALMRGRSPAPAGNQAAAAASGPESAGSFTQEAVIGDEDGYANVRAGPSADAAVVARVNAGETFNTYAQDGAWWRVRIAGGLTGYMERARIRVREPLAVPALAGPAPAAQGAAPAVPAPQTAPQPRPRPPRAPKPAGPRLNPENSGIARDYCEGPGMGTPVCRRLGLGGRRRR